MTSLTEVYESNAREVSSLRRVYAGTALVLAGAILAILAVLVATTDFFISSLGDVYVAREYGGILGGLAVPVALVGVFTVLPSGRRIRAAAAISASICLLGVALFWYAYPHHWAGYGQNLTVYVSGIYLVGLFSSVWCLFTAIVNFKTRNDPGGMLEMNVTRRGKTKVVEVADSRGFGSVGFLGGTPDGDVETQTNTGTSRSGRSSSGRSRRRSSGGTGSIPVGAGVTTSDGGTSTDDISSPLDTPQSGDGGTEVMRSGDRTATNQVGGEATRSVSAPSSTTPDRSASDSPRTKPADQYCGNCSSFSYRRSPSKGMIPYCGYHDETMDDMDACSEWTPNHPR